MTPDKVEAALASLKQVSAAIACPDLPRRTRADESRWAATITEALATLTSALAEARDGWEMANGVAELAMKHRDAAEAALAESERDAARYRWLRNDPPVNLCVRRHPGETERGCYLDGAPLDQAIDAAMKGTDHAR